MDENMAVYADDIKAHLHAAVENDSLILPVLPEITLEVREVDDVDTVMVARPQSCA